MIVSSVIVVVVDDVIVVVVVGIVDAVVVVVGIVHVAVFTAAVVFNDAELGRNFNFVFFLVLNREKTDLYIARGHIFRHKFGFFRFWDNFRFQLIEVTEMFRLPVTDTWTFIGNSGSNVGTEVLKIRRSGRRCFPGLGSGCRVFRDLSGACRRRVQRKEVDPASTIQKIVIF